MTAINLVQDTFFAQEVVVCHPGADFDLVAEVLFGVAEVGWVAAITMLCFGVNVLGKTPTKRNPTSDPFYEKAGDPGIAEGNQEPALTNPAF